MLDRAVAFPSPAAARSARRRRRAESVLRSEHAHRDVVHAGRAARRRRRDLVRARRVELGQGRDDRRHRDHAARDRRARDRRAPSRVGLPAPAGRSVRRPRHQRGRRHARASDAGAARSDDAAPASSGASTGLRVAIVGDILHSRVARSNIVGMRMLGIDVTLVGPRHAAAAMRSPAGRARSSAISMPCCRASTRS